MQDRFKFRVWLKELIKPRMTYTSGLSINKNQIDDSDNIVMQSTGLTDKNGKLIYEGDIVQFYDDEFLQTMKIIWDNDELDFKAIGLKKSVECYEQDFSYLGCIKKEDSLKVIGNIYENKELLNDSN